MVGRQTPSCIILCLMLVVFVEHGQEARQLTSTPDWRSPVCGEFHHLLPVHLGLRLGCVQPSFGVGVGSLCVYAVRRGVHVSFVCSGALWESWIRDRRERRGCHCHCFGYSGALDHLVLRVAAPRTESIFTDGRRGDTGRNGTKGIDWVTKGMENDTAITHHTRHSSPS